jgi:1,4-alpha-glucan branching enzyme
VGSQASAKTKRVKFQLQAEPGCEVFVAGTFNSWNPRKTRMTYGDGVYSTTVTLPKGRYEYKFIIDDVWCIDPNCTEWAPNGLGSLNSVVVVV